MDAYLLELARGIAEGRVDYSGLSVPTALQAIVASASGFDDERALLVARLVLQAMAAQRAVDLRLAMTSTIAPDGEEGAMGK